MLLLNLKIGKKFIDPDDRPDRVVYVKETDPVEAGEDMKIKAVTLANGRVRHFSPEKDVIPV